MNLSALKSSPFRSYVVSLHLALNGFWAQRVIIGWLAWEMIGSAGFVGLVTFLNFFPTVFVSPLFGVFAGLCILGSPTPILLALFSLVTGVISSANHPMRTSLTPRLAPASDLPSVVAITSLNFKMSRLTGPAIGGILIQTIGAPLAFAVTALTYAAPVTAIYFMQPRERATPAQATATGYLNQLAEGWRYALARQHLRAAVIFAGIGALAWRSVLAALPILANGVFGQGPSGLGYMTAAAGAAAAAASIFKAVSRPQTPGEFHPQILAMPVIIPLLVAALAMIGNFATAVAAVALIGATVTLMSISLQSTVQMEIEDQYRGRVMGLWTTISIGSGAVGAMLMGFLVDLIGVAPAQLMIGLVLAAASILVLLRFRRGLSRLDAR